MRVLLKNSPKFLSESQQSIFLGILRSSFKEFTRFQLTIHRISFKKVSIPLRNSSKRFCGAPFRNLPELHSGVQKSIKDFLSPIHRYSLRNIPKFPEEFIRVQPLSKVPLRNSPQFLSGVHRSSSRAFTEILLRNLSFFPPARISPAFPCRMYTYFFFFQKITGVPFKSPSYELSRVSLTNSPEFLLEIHQSLFQKRTEISVRNLPNYL